ncbi:MAG: flagellar motor switch protein FliN [Pseudomonadota bacterium]
MNDETNQESPDQQAMADEWAAAMAEQDTPEGADEQEKETASQQEREDVQRATMQELQDDADGPGSEDVNMDVILDIPVTIALEIGRTRINIRNLLQLNQGSVVELDRLAGEPLDVMVNGTLIAHGEVVVVNEKYGIRLTDVISPAERVKKLK